MREAGTILIQKFSANGKTPLSRVKIVRGLLDDKMARNIWMQRGGRGIGMKRQRN